MEPQEKELFLKMLARAMGAYGRPLPDAGIIAAWLDELKPYPLSIISLSFRAYCDENGEFAPVPAGIAKRCKLMDGRPSCDEAWAIALTSRDESETVVWTSEIAEAFAICSPVFPDEVGARMAFKDAYNRLISTARAANRPAQWVASLGWDIGKREASIVKAGNDGLLGAKAVVALLPAPSADPIVEPDSKARAQIESIKKMMIDMASEKSRQSALHAQREHEKNVVDHERQAELARNYAKGAA